MQKALKNSKVTCPECQLGNYFLKLKTYYVWMGDELITVPDFPCWVCDSCKSYQFDQQSVKRLDIMLNNEVGTAIQNSQKATQKPSFGKNTHRPGQIK